MRAWYSAGNMAFLAHWLSGTCLVLPVETQGRAYPCAMPQAEYFAHAGRHYQALHGAQQLVARPSQVLAVLPVKVDGVWAEG